MATNIVKWEEGTEITLDSEVEAPAAGWHLAAHCSVLRIGNLVALHLELAFDAAAAAHALTIPPQFAPADTVTTPDGKFLIHADGTVTFPGSTAVGANAICQAVYAAGEASP